jgi:hypothetical protein
MYVLFGNTFSYFIILALFLLFIRTNTCSRTDLKGGIYGLPVPVCIRFAVIE